MELADPVVWTEDDARNFEMLTHKKALIESMQRKRLLSAIDLLPQNELRDEEIANLLIENAAVFIEALTPYLKE